MAMRRQRTSRWPERTMRLSPWDRRILASTRPWRSPPSAFDPRLRDGASWPPSCASAPPKSITTPTRRCTVSSGISPEKSPTTLPLTDQIRPRAARRVRFSSFWRDVPTDSFALRHRRNAHRAGRQLDGALSRHRPANLPATLKSES